MDDFKEIIGKVRIEDYIGKTLSRSSRKMGSWLEMGECPFCGGHDCFRVHPERQSFFCFQCEVGGDVVNFVRHYFKLGSNFEALKRLAQETGHELKNGKAFREKSKIAVTREKIFGVAAEFYHQKLLANEKALNYLIEKRGHPLELIKRFKIGCSGDDRQELTRHLFAAKFSHEDILNSGLVTKIEDAQKKSRFSDFIGPGYYIFPWMLYQNVGHFSLKDPSKKNPDYQLKNEFRTSGLQFYNQSHIFRDKIIIVEGENDLMTTVRALEAEDSLRDYGAIGSRGQISTDQIAFLKAACKGKEVYFAFDNDAAGEKYTSKVISALVDVCEVYVVEITPPSKDIDEYLRADDFPGIGLAKLIEHSRDGIEWEIHGLENHDNVLKIRKIIEPVLELIARISDDRIEAYIDLLLAKYQSLKRSNIVKQLKTLGAEVDGANVIRNFEVYDSTSQIYVSENCYWVPTKDDKRMISNFTFQLVNIYAYEDATTSHRYLKYECILKNYKGVVSEPLVFDPDDRVNVMKFMSKSASMGEFHFWGSTQNLLNVWSYVEHNAENVRITNLLQKYGFMPHHGIWLFENCAVKGGRIYTEKDGIITIDGRGFKSENVLIYGGDRPRMNFREKLSDEFVHEVVQKFWQVCDGEATRSGDYPNYRGLMLIGFVPAMIYRKEIMDRYGLFPLLTAYGPSQTGKSVITQILFSFWGFSNPAEAWEGMTPPGLTQFLAQVNSLPVWLDEFRNNSNRYHKTLMGTLRNAYNGVAPGKGGLQKRMIWDVGGCVWLSGEDTPDDRATLSRCAVARFTEINPVRTEAYNWFQRQKDKLSAITLRLITDKSKESAAEFLEDIEKVSNTLLDMGISDERTRINISIPVAGFYRFHYRDEDYTFQNDLLSWVAEQAEEDRLRKAGEDVLTKFFEDMSRLMVRSDFSQCVRFMDEDVIAFAFNEYYAEYRKQLRLEGDNIDDFKKSTIKDYIIKSPFFIRGKDRNDHTAMIGERIKRVFKLDINKMPEHLKELFTNFTEKEF